MIARGSVLGSCSAFHRGWALLVVFGALLAFVTTTGCGQSAPPPASKKVASGEGDAKTETPAKSPATKPAPATPAAPSGGGATPWQDSLGTVGVSGTVSWQGDAPKNPALDEVATNPDCAKMHKEALPKADHYVVTDNKLANVLVYVKSGPIDTYKFTPNGVTEISQQGCAYQPRVVGVMVGQKVVFVNSDPVSHNIQFRDVKFNDPLTKTQSPNQSDEYFFKKPEVGIDVGCDVHSWMHCYITALHHPFFAVTGADGKFAFPGKLPAGEYEIAAYHPKAKCDEKVKKVTLAGDSATVDFTFRK